MAAASQPKVAKKDPIRNWLIRDKVYDVIYLCQIIYVEMKTNYSRS